MHRVVYKGLILWSLQFADGMCLPFAGGLLFAVCGWDTHPVAQRLMY